MFGHQHPTLAPFLPPQGRRLINASGRQCRVAGHATSAEVLRDLCCYSTPPRSTATLCVFPSHAYVKSQRLDSAAEHRRREHHLGALLRRGARTTTASRRQITQVRPHSTDNPADRTAPSPGPSAAGAPSLSLFAGARWKHGGRWHSKGCLRRLPLCTFLF